MANITIYEHANFQGLSQVLPRGQYDDALNEISIGNDTLSSLKVPHGLVVRLYEHFHFQGRFIDITEDTPAISLFWNDRISSLIVYAATTAPPVIKDIMIFEDANYQGNSQILQPGKYDDAQISIGNDTLSSTLVPYGMVLRLFEHANFQGAFIDIREDTPAVSMDWNDRASSIIIYEAKIGSWIISNDNAAIIGESTEFNGVRGISHSGGQGANGGAVVGLNDNSGPGVFGQSTGVGVYGKSNSWIGVYGESETSSAIWGKGKTWNGVFGITESTTGGAGVMGEATGLGIGVKGKGGKLVAGGIYDGGLAGYFEGNVEVTGDIRLTNADCAEEFDICETDQIEPGTVMVLGEDGKLHQSQKAYDKRVAGVISGAGDYKPGIVLDRQPSSNKRMALAMVGKVYCKVDSQYGAIEVGDLLTTSPTPGHAMKANDPMHAFGAVIGKALRSLNSGTGLVPLLVALQ